MNEKLGATERNRAGIVAGQLAGGLLIASGFAHSLVWLFQGGSMQGASSLRKPILFGFSAGVTVLSLTWVLPRLRRRVGDSLLLALFALAMVFEVGLISLQQWRGVPSHFNQSSQFDAIVLFWIELLVVVATIVIADFTRRSFQHLSARPDMALAIRGGLALLLFSCGMGFILVFYGNQQVALGQSPEKYGAAGVMKFPHGVPMHAIQMLPVCAALLKRLRVPTKQRVKSVTYALSSCLLFTTYSILQTFTGRARFEFWWLSMPVLLAAAILLCMCVASGTSHFRERLVRTLWLHSRRARGSQITRSTTTTLGAGRNTVGPLQKKAAGTTDLGRASS